MNKLFASSLMATGFLAFAANAENYYIKNIDVEGLQRVEKETVLSYLNLTRNQTISQDVLDDSFKRLYNTGLFSDISFDTTAKNTLKINVKENPIIGKRAFDGNDKIADKILEGEVQLGPRSVYDKAKVQQDVQRILDVYRRTGRYSVTVEPKIIEREENRVDLIYEINEGAAAKIDKINFLGNTHYSASDLQDEIMSKESRWYRFFSSAEDYDSEKMNYDKELLRRFYTNRGYADFKVESAVAELSEDNKSFILTFSIYEGPRYKINNISIVSDIKDIDTDSLYSELEIENGDWFNASLIEKSVSQMTEALGRKGFAFTDAEPEYIRNEENNTIDIVFHINESERIFVDRINISGNDRTLDKVIRREFRVDEGDALNVAALRDSRRNVENLNYFSKVDIQTTPTGPNKADIDVNVEEKSTGYFNVGVGYSTTNGALVRFGVTENNFRGRGEELGFNVGISQRTKDYDISFTEPYFLNRRLSAGADLFMQDQDYEDEASYDTRTVGGRIRFGWNYTDNLYHFTRYTLSTTDIKNVKDYASEYVKAEKGKSTTSAVGQTLVYDKRDNAINTKEGYYLSFGNDIAGLGGDEKYNRFDAKAYKFYTVADYYTFKFFATGGYIAGYDHKKVRMSDRYYLGGNTMRGFEFAGIGARDKRTKDALGGNWMMYSGVEMTFPIGLDELGIKGKTFYDMGALGKPDHFNSEKIYYSSKIRSSVGFGFDWMSPMGKIDIDFGFPISKEPYDEKEVFRLNFGTSL
ncbi:MAG: outer membrane protein assembly factor BamA [Alphaproteobacteria bacterium]|nr:outer membrane protein assembly factor BamA [Alphaproteobacteria bacterium]